MKIIDANNIIVGRLATFAAKQALLGEEVHVINCENAVISGSKKNLKEEYTRKIHMGIHSKGPNYYRVPYMFVKRIIRGMLPHKKTRGREALKRIKCYNTTPEKFKNQQIGTFTNADISKLKTLKYMKVKDICKVMGGK